MKGWRSPKLAALVITILFAALAAILVLSQPAPHSPLEYMVAGAVATTGWLFAAYTLLARLIR